MLTTPFGDSLRHWRRRRGLSQLELSGRSATTTRHLSFLETGRSRPSRAMVERLAASLELPLRERNRLLHLAGLPAAFPQGDLDADDLAPFRRVIDRMLAAHEPFPGLVLDRHWDVLRTNAAASFLVPESGERNAVRLAVDTWRPLVENWDDVAPSLLERLERDLRRAPTDERLAELHALVENSISGRPQPTTGRVLCPRFRFGDQVVRTVTVVAAFEHAVDVTLDEVRVELIYPEDAAAEEFFRTAATLRHAAPVGT